MVAALAIAAFRSIASSESPCVHGNPVIVSPQSVRRQTAREASMTRNADNHSPDCPPWCPPVRKRTVV